MRKMGTADRARVMANSGSKKGGPDMRHVSRIALLILAVLVCLITATAANSESEDIVVHKGETTITELWDTVDNKGVFEGYRSVVRGEAENVSDKTIYRPHVRIIILGADNAKLSKELVPLGIMDPGDKVKIGAEMTSKTSYAADFEWEIVDWPTVATEEQLEASQWDEYNVDPGPAVLPMISGAIAVAIALAVTVLLFIIFRRRRQKRRMTGQTSA